MGCVVSDENTGKPGANKGAGAAAGGETGSPAKYKDNSNNGAASGQGASGDKSKAGTSSSSAAGAPSSSPTTTSNTDASKNGGGDEEGGGKTTGTELQGRQKFLEDIGAAVTTVGERTAVSTLFLLTSQRNSKHGIVLSYLSVKDEKLYAAEISDDELGKQKVAQNISYPWSALFKSMTSDTLKSKVKITEADASVIVEFGIVSVKDKTKLPFKLTLLKVAATNDNRHRLVLEPMTRMVQKRRQVSEEREKEQKTSRLQTQLQLQELSIALHRATIDRLKPSMGALREESAFHAKISADLTTQIGRIERKIKILERGQVRNELDDMYERGGARTFAHLPQADTHLPELKDKVTEWPLTNFILEGFAGVADVRTELIEKPISDPEIKKLYDTCSETQVQAVLNCMAKIDDWDYSVFECEKATGGNALFYTTYAILCKLKLGRQLNIDDAVLRRFLMHVQAGYHPNPYHNSTHAADVCQVNYYILTKGGLAEKCKLNKEELFAAILSGAIHDYDHPGFNNSFHTRTNAYLSTLYNDRSILENHHLACVFEMMRRPEYNIMEKMTDDQKKDVRDTMCEMVLSTDMGLHGKIFGAFRRRLSDAPDWSATADDKRLALSMAIKMADTSNCGRPTALYQEWAKAISLEFYHQGDVEASMCLPISPYMDRRKESEFPKGQIFFMNVVVIGMYEKMADLLPPLDVAVRLCSANKAYWTSLE
jgi:hypothetical protein